MMVNDVITDDIIENFLCYLKEEEKSSATIEKYIRDVKRFAQYADGQRITKELVMRFKQELLNADLAVSSINSILAAVGSILSFLGLEACKVRNLRTQPKAYCDADRELTRKEYERLVKAAEHNSRLELLLQTICSTGIRVSELAYFTVEAAKKGEITVSCKNKTRTILIPKQLCKLLIRYAQKRDIKSGIIFRTKNGKPMDRSNIWREMKRLCEQAHVKMSKVFPHNLRKLFARSFYNKEKDIAKLADVLGHSSINTTRIYIMTSGKEHRRKIEQLGLVINTGEISPEKRKAT